MKLLLAAICGLFLLSACSDRDSGDSTATPTATPTVFSENETPQPSATPDTSNCPVDAETCLLALEFIGAWERKDIDALVAMSRPLETKCTVPRPSGLGGPYPLCDDATVDGEVRHGYVWSSGTHGGLAGVEKLRGDLTRATAAGKPLLTIGCRIVPGTPDECEGSFSLAFGPHAYGGELEQVAELVVVREGSSAHLVGVLPVFVSNCAVHQVGFACALINGGVMGGRGYEYWGDESRIPRPLPDWEFFHWTP